MSRFGIERLLFAWVLACSCAPVAAQIVIAQVSPQEGYLGFPLRQNSCRLYKIKPGAAIRDRNGKVLREIQKQSGISIAAAGKCTSG